MTEYVQMGHDGNVCYCDNHCECPGYGDARTLVNRKLMAVMVPGEDIGDESWYLSALEVNAIELAFSENAGERAILAIKAILAVRSTIASDTSDCDSDS